jgi:hypothetical protein
MISKAGILDHRQADQMEKGVPLVFTQSDNDRLCSLMSSILQRNVFSDRSVRFLQACEDSFGATAQALSYFRSSSQIAPPMILLIRNESEFHIRVAGKLRDVLANCGCIVDGKAQRRAMIPLLDVYQADHEQQISEILDAFDGKRSLYVIAMRSSPSIWLRPVLAGTSRVVGILFALPTVQEMEQMVLQLTAASMTTGTSPTMMLLAHCSTATVKIATTIQRRVPTAICVLLPDTDETSMQALPAFLARAILHFVLSNQNLEYPKCRM